MRFGFRRSVSGLVWLLVACHREPADQTSAPATAAQPALEASKEAVPPTVSLTAQPDATVQRGAQLYTSMCAVCHGSQGEGYRADNAPALHQQDFLASTSDVYL